MADIIVEEIQESRFLTEAAANGAKNYFLEGIFLQSEIKNQNQRIYPKKVLSEAVNEYHTSFISKNRGYGELGHPEKPGINFDRVCILTQELREDGKNYIGKAKVIDTPAGKIVKTLIDEGVTLGVSSRGRGAVKNGIVQNGYRLVTAVDVVADPSAPDAFVQALVEGKEWVMVNGVLTEQEMEGIRESVLGANKAQLRETQRLALKNFFAKISQN